MTTSFATILEDDIRRDNELMNARKRLREATETIERLTADNARLVREQRALRTVVQQQARLLDRSEPARVTYAQPQGGQQ